MSLDGLQFSAPVQELEAEAEAGQAENAAQESETEQEHDSEPVRDAEPSRQSGPEDQRGEVSDGRELDDSRARAMRGTSHRRARLGLGTQVGANGAETGAPQADRQARMASRARVNIVAGRGSKLSLAAGAMPSEEQLFTRTERGGRRVTHMRGTNAVPSVEPTMKPESLFIGGRPDAADVRQGGLGDCYFDSTLLGLTANDPGKITSMMSISGNQVSVNLFRQNNAGEWVNKTIRTSTSLLTRRGRDGEIRLVGNRLRISSEPVESLWWAELNGTTLEVRRRDVYETGLWAPMMEKAYADFAQTYGRYGEGKDADERRMRGGYNMIDAGGASEWVYQVFYGGAATANTTDLAFTPGSDIVSSNAAGMRQLLQFEGRRGNTGAGQTQQFMHARIGATGAATRGRDLIDQIKGILLREEISDTLDDLLDPGDIGDVVDRLLRGVDRTVLRGQLDALRAVLVNFLAGGATQSDVATAAGPLFTVDAYAQLWDDAAPAPFRHLRQNLGTLANLGSDSGPGRRQVYAAHAYHIKSVNLVDRAGAALALTPADIPARAGEIDAERSFVVVENPHATNEPDLRGERPAVDDGRFNMTLDEFLRSFDLLRFADVQH